MDGSRGLRDVRLGDVESYFPVQVDCHGWRFEAAGSGVETH